jgi:excisionase family DNA binding protein
MIVQEYKNRSYLSAIEAAKFIGASVDYIHQLAHKGIISAKISPGGQMRFNLKDLKNYLKSNGQCSTTNNVLYEKISILELNETVQIIVCSDASNLKEIKDNSIHLMITSPPYFNTKMYSKEPLENDLGNVHDLRDWYDKIAEVWREVFRVLQPGRKAFINIMNLPVRSEDKSFRTLNLSGKTIEIYEKIGFIFKRDIIWHKTNGVRAHFGTYPYPGGILLNNMHEFILEFAKPEKKGFDKYKHLTKEQKEQSKIDKEFWLSLKNSDVWMMKPQGSGDRRNHVAPFPLELPYRLIKAYSYIGETVLDPFVGSGTTLLAAIDLKRNGIGYEINPEIAGEAIETIKKYQEKFI